MGPGNLGLRIVRQLVATEDGALGTDSTYELWPSHLAMQVVLPLRT